MGTNYYHRTDVCPTCHRGTEAHICKSLTMFQTVEEWQDVGPPVQSWQEWKERLRAGGEVWDEYGTRWGVEEFIAAVEETTPDARRRQYDAMAAEPFWRHRVEDGTEFLDPDGFSFSRGEFSRGEFS